MQLSLRQSSGSDSAEGPSPVVRRAIESDEFPFEPLSRIAERESWRKEIYRPTYHIHKWWAQRLGSIFRGIIIGALVPEGTDVLDLFYSPTRFPDTVVFDPFMGSGTTLGETLKLGGRAIGRDINPVSFIQVRTALTLADHKELERIYREIETDVSQLISSYYVSTLPDGTECPVLYYFWVMQAPCPSCHSTIDLFSRYVFARHAYSQRNPAVQVVCPHCGAVSRKDSPVSWTSCSGCGHSFDATDGPVKGKTAKCPHCLSQFAIGSTIRESGSPPTYRMYAKLVLTPEGNKEYHDINDHDEALYRKALSDLERSRCRIPRTDIEPGYNTNQVLHYGFKSWRHMFNARQLLCISTLADRIKQIEDLRLRDAFTCLFSGTLEFNNMFASYKGEGTGAVRHMFSHHILKPERTPLEANVWGTPKSSGSFSTLFRRRLLRAVEYAHEPFELTLGQNTSGRRSAKVRNINEPLSGLTNSESYGEFDRGARLYVSCGDSSVTDLPDGSAHLVITDPPFFDNVHYSQLADFFYVWQKLILEDHSSHREDSTRSCSEVQDSDPGQFTGKLTLVLSESARVLRDDGLLVFTYHHSRWEGWRSVLEAVMDAGLAIVACHPVKAEMSVATPKSQAKSPINFDIIMVCRKSQRQPSNKNVWGGLELKVAIERASTQVENLRTNGWQLSRNDIAVIVTAQVVSGMSRTIDQSSGQDLFKGVEEAIVTAIDRFVS